MNVPLTQLTHGGGCGCKIAPGQLREILSALPLRVGSADLLVGLESGDDAVVYRVSESRAVVATTDFFMPIVDDPVDFGRISATNALSDVYAVGGRPIFALAVVGMPMDKLPSSTIEKILDGGAAVCETIGIPVAGGHSIDSVEPIYGLVAIGMVEPAKIKRNNTARANDVLILGKGIGVGVLSAALKRGRLGSDAYGTLIETTTKLNDIGAELADLETVHAMTDVTGFGLLGHLLEMCRGSALRATIEFDRVRILPHVQDLVSSGVVTGASGRNWNSYGHEVSMSESAPDWHRDLLCDPQTSGGLLLAVEPESAQSVLDLFHRRGYRDAGVVGTLKEGEPVVRVV